MRYREKDELVEEELDEASGGLSYLYYASSANFNLNSTSLIGGIRGPGTADRTGG